MAKAKEPPLWAPMFSLPNVHVKFPIDVDGFALVAPDDFRIKAIKKQQPRLRSFLKNSSPSSAIPSSQAPSSGARTSRTPVHHQRYLRISRPYTDVVHSPELGQSSPVRPCAWTMYSDTFAVYPWMVDNKGEGQPVPYYHVVFTLPAAIADIAYQNKAVIYDLLLKASAEALTTIAADPTHLSARVGIPSVLHTWGSAMTHHPHVYMIVPGGGISLDGERWVACRPGFFLPVRVLSPVPTAASGEAACRIPGRPPEVLRRSRRSRRRAGVRGLPGAAAPSRMGGLPSARSAVHRPCRAIPTASPSPTTG